MKKTPKAKEYIDSVDGNAHNSAVVIIEELEAKIVKLTEFAVDSLGMAFNAECESCKANQDESIDRAEKLSVILPETI